MLPELLVIDEMGHDRLELEVTKEAHLLFKVIDQRYNQDKPLIFTTNVEESDWADFLGDPVDQSNHRPHIPPLDHNKDRWAKLPQV